MAAPRSTALKTLSLHTSTPFSEIDVSAVT